MGSIQRYMTRLVILLFLTGLGACDRTDSQPTHSTHKLLWSRLQENFCLEADSEVDGAQVEKHLENLLKNKHALEKILVQASPYLYYIVSELEKRELPGELALIPIIESNFFPHATSSQGAAGLWQFIPSTAKHYGLEQNPWYDARRDIQASTDAALHYFESLYERFDQNWILAIAAYNAGESRVRKAIQHNRKQKKKTKFSSLSLPKETRHYLPKVLALTEILTHPKRYGISLPPIENKPYFVEVRLTQKMDFTTIAKLTELSIVELKKLNPAHSHHSIHPSSPQKLLLPIEQVKKLYQKHTKDALI